MHFNFRPHHLLCTFCFQGEGYSATFLQNYLSIVKRLDDADVTIKIISQSDDICSPCPHNTGKHCTTENKISALDAAHTSALAINIGDELTWAQAKIRIRKNISLEIFHKICKGCEWKTLGICEKKITEEII